MLGKTNLTTLKEGAIVDDIADYGWLDQQVGVNGNFVRVICKNNYLAGITGDGAVVYTTDGEEWKISRPEYEGILLNDIEWDGSRFLLSGSYAGEDGKQSALILSTANFEAYELINIQALYMDSVYQKDKICEIFAIYNDGRNYVVFAASGINDSGQGRRLALFYGDLKNRVNLVYKQDSTGEDLVAGSVSFAKNTSKVLAARSTKNSGTSIYEGTEQDLKITASFRTSSGGYDTVPVTLFECKDELHYITNSSSQSYKFYKILETGGESLMSTGINWMFTDGVYFNGCQVFLNNHHILIVKKGENIGDKTLEDLIEIAPEQTMTCIEKAFGKLYIFGKRGLILKSTNEVNSEEGILVQNLSAKQALAQSKAYTDEQIAALTARVAALEAFHQTQ